VQVVITRRVVNGNVTLELEQCTRKEKSSKVKTTMEVLMIYTVDPMSGKIKTIQSFKGQAAKRKFEKHDESARD
jgi:hypothetical protein